MIVIFVGGGRLATLICCGWCCVVACACLSREGGVSLFLTVASFDETRRDEMRYDTGSIDP